MSEKKPAITARNEIETRGGATHHGVAQRSGLPGDGVDWSGAEDGFGDFLIGGPCTSTVDRAEAFDEALSALRRNSRVSRCSVMKGSIAEPNNRLDSILHELVDEGNGRHRSVRCSAIEADCHEVLGVDHKVNIESFIRCSGVVRNDLEVHGCHV